MGGTGQPLPSRATETGVGATLNHLPATGSTPSEAATARMVEVVVDGLRRRD